MADTPAPLLVHNRIDANRRNTRVLLVCFAALTLPAAWGVSQLLIALLTMQSGASAIEPMRLVTPVGWREQLFAFYMAVVSTATILSITYLTSLFSNFILWRNGARPLGNQHPELRRLVDNLCVGAGLPPPKLYITTSDAPNAFAIGFDPRNAKLVVSQGLLALLDRRELSAVIAHELSHIANRDTNLSTLLAAVTTTVRLPQTLFMGVLNLFRGAGAGRAVIFLLFYGSTFLYAVVAAVVSAFSLVAHSVDVPGAESFGRLMVMLLPMYILGFAPMATSFLRKRISHEREFLADADAALLTNDPEGVALALAKVSAAIGVSRERDPATAHLFFIDPSPPERLSWLRGVFPTHPDPEERIALLTRMGDGHVEGLAAASDAGVDYRGALLLRHYAPLKVVPLSGTTRNDGAPSPSVAGRLERSGVSAAVSSRLRTGSELPVTMDHTPLYEKADGLSAIVQTLSAGLVVTVLGFEGNFAHVHTERGEGYIPRGAIAPRATALTT